MTAAQPVVVDANVLFSALLRSDSSFTRTLLTSERAFLVCESTIVELFKHKEKLVRSSRLSETDIVRLFYLLLRHPTIYREVLIAPEVRRQAYNLCADIDEADTPQVALALHVDALLWTGDKRLRSGLRNKG